MATTFITPKVIFKETIENFRNKLNITDNASFDEAVNIYDYREICKSIIEEIEKQKSTNIIVTLSPELSEIWREMQYFSKNNKCSINNLKELFAPNVSKIYILLSKILQQLINTKEVQQGPLRFSNVDEEKNRVTELEKEIEKAKKELKNSKENNTTQKEKIEALNQEKAELQKIIKSKEEEVKNEKELEDRITKTFIDLTNRLDFLKKEETRNMVEYYVYNSILVLLMFGIAYWLWILIKHTTGSNDATNWYQHFVPWYTPIPIFIAIFWVVIVFRNRANRYLLRIREELFKIKYSEGLLLAISRLSKSTEEGAARVTEVLDIMVKSYMNQIETSFLFESKKTERDTPVDASDITKAAEVITDFADKIKDIAKPK